MALLDFLLTQQTQEVAQLEKGADTVSHGTDISHMPVSGFSSYLQSLTVFRQQPLSEPLLRPFHSFGPGEKSWSLSR